MESACFFACEKGKADKEKTRLLACCCLQLLLLCASRITIGEKLKGSLQDKAPLCVVEKQQQQHSKLFFLFRRQSAFFFLFLFLLCTSRRHIELKSVTATFNLLLE